MAKASKEHKRFNLVYSLRPWASIVALIAVYLPGLNTSMKRTDRVRVFQPHPPGVLEDFLETIEPAKIRHFCRPVCEDVMARSTT